MLGINRWKSIRWKFIFIYFLLVFIAMVIVGVFILQQLESYHLKVVSDDLDEFQESIMSTLEKYDDLTEKKDEIQSNMNINIWFKGIEEEIYIIDNHFNIIASSNENVLNNKASESLDVDLLRDGFRGERAEKDITKENELPTKNKVVPIMNQDGTIKGLLYLRANLSNIYDTLDQAKLIFLRAIILALFITVILGFLIARSITVPINDVTEKAERMAKGDFSQKVSVKSDDEIGRLAEMFNFLRDKLDFTLSEISNEKSKLETILKYMADGLIAVDINGYIIHANPASKQMLGIYHQDIFAKTYDEIIGKYSDQLKLSAIKNQENNWEGNVNFQYLNSTFLARYAPFKDESGDNIGIVMILQDITERQKIDNMQREFVANVSHELKTPLTSIKSYTETLLDGALSDTETAKQFLSVVNSESDRMGRLVKDLLQLSRLEYQREKWNKVQANLIEILKAAVLKMNISAKSKNQHLNCLFKEENICVYVDKDSIEQVILNIISNAIKYTQEYGRVDIDTIKTEDEVRIIIQDNGIGIPKEDLPRLFERFYRVDKARSRALGGTGLGLSIAKQIMKEHQGDIEIESHEGKGTRVSIILPLTAN